MKFDGRTQTGALVKSQSDFVCGTCGFTDLADHNAALNISWIAVKQAMFSDALTTGSVVPRTSHLL
jgi:transposase